MAIFLSNKFTTAIIFLYFKFYRRFEALKTDCELSERTTTNPFAIKIHKNNLFLCHFKHMHHTVCLHFQHQKSHHLTFPAQQFDPIKAAPMRNNN